MFKPSVDICYVKLTFTVVLQRKGWIMAM